MVITTSANGTQPLAGVPPYNAPSLFRRACYLSALLSLSIGSDTLVYLDGNGGWRGVTEGEIGAVRPKTLAEHLGIPLSELAKWLAPAISDGYVLKIAEPPVFASAAKGSPLVVVRASCLGVAWLGQWRQGKAL